MAIKVLYDDQVFSNQIYGGISRYFTELIGNLTQGDFDFQFHLPTLYSRNHYLAESNLLKSKMRLNFKGGIRLGIMANRFLSRNALKSQNFDIFHPTYYNPYFLEVIRNKPYVITVYDMIHELYPNYFNNSDHTSNYKKQLLQGAARIHAISNNTKNDIIRLLEIDGNKIDVIPLGHSFFESKENQKIEYEYILFVGERGYYKNFINFLKSIVNIITDNKNLYLICAGGGAFNLEELEIMTTSNIIHKVIHRSPTDVELAGLYKNARCFIFPSLYEGFGLPIIEALQYDCPVVLSNLSSFPEIAGLAGIYFDPYSIKSMEKSISFVLSNAFNKYQFTKDAKVVCDKYTWKNCAKATYESYKKIV